MTGLKVLVTGAHGFIGRHVARCLAGHGHRVTGIGHGRWTGEEWRSWGLETWIENDISRESLNEFANTPDTIVHCAGGGSVAFSLGNPLSDFQRTVATSVAVMDYVRQASPTTRIVYPSSAGVYGAVKDVPIKEDTPCGPVSPYGMHKWIAEQVVSSYCGYFGLSGSIVRLFSVYGCGLRKQLLWDGCHKLTSGDHVFMGTGNEVRDWLHVDDAAELLHVAMERASPQCPVANGGTGEGVSVREILTHLANCLRAGSEKLVFSEAPRAGDPSIYIADTTKARGWCWKPGAHWRDRVAEYAAWWMLEMGMPTKPPSSHTAAMSEP
jgi:UDP-glucose 4-epimerase